MLLRKADVVEGALKFLDAEGLDGLTMRKLGAALNVQGGALYRHFPNKAALLDAMAEKILEGIGEPLPDVPWHDQVYILGTRFRAALLAHRDGARLVASTHATGATIALGDLAVTIFCGAGLAPAEAGSLAFALGYYVLGHTIEEQTQVHPSSGDEWQSRKARLATDVSPQYAEAIDSLTSTDPTQRFTYGLNTFIQGIASRIQPTRPAPATR